jgi:hypothetical protein
VSEAELDGLEREVIEARRRLAYDLKQLRAPATVQEFKDEMVGYKDDLVNQVAERGVDAGKEKIHAVIDDLKQRAVANPAAALSIGAGIAWHLLRRPPITSALIGFGLFSLLRTPPAPPKADAREKLWQQASAAARYAGELGQELGGRVSEAVQSGIEQARDIGSMAVARASETAERGYVEAAAAAERLPLEKIGEARDQILLGAAALSVTAAVAIMMARDSADDIR